MGCCCSEPSSKHQPPKQVSQNQSHLHQQQQISQPQQQITQPIPKTIVPYKEGEEYDSLNNYRITEIDGGGGYHLVTMSKGSMFKDQKYRYNYSKLRNVTCLYRNNISRKKL